MTISAKTAIATSLGWEYKLHRFTLHQQYGTSMTIKFKDITTSEELRGRVKNGRLSVGIYRDSIQHLLRETGTSAEAVTVEYARRFNGTSTRTYFISIAPTENLQSV